MKNNESEYPKRMLVSDIERFEPKKECIVLGEVMGYYVVDEESLDDYSEINETTSVSIFKYAKDIEPKEEEKEVKHLLKEGDCVETHSKGTYLMLCALCDKLGINRHEKMVDYYADGYENIIFEENVIAGIGESININKLSLPQFINKMIGVEEKPKVSNKVINNINCRFSYIDEEYTVYLQRGGHLTEDNLKEMLHTLEEMK